MGYAGKFHERQLAIKLRKKGLSIRSIQERLGVSRSSVSLWVRDVRLDDELKQRLFENIKSGQLRGSLIAAQNKKERRLNQEELMRQNGIQEVANLSSRDFFIAGIALYFAEGDKRSNHIAFSNTDPRAIGFMMKWFRKFLHVPDNKFRFYLYLHDDLDELQSRVFWSKIADVELSQFNKSYIIPNREFRFRKTRHEYGVLRISISDVRLLRRLLGWISAFLDASIIKD